MLRIARRRNVANTLYVLASSNALPITDASSDCSVSISTAKAGSNHSAFIADLKRISRPDALLAFTLFQQPGLPSHESLLKPERPTIIADREPLVLLPAAEAVE